MNNGLLSGKPTVKTDLLAGRLRSGRWSYLPAGTSGSNGSLGNGTLRCVPFWVPNPVRLSALAGEIAGAGEAGSKLRIGLYEAEKDIDYLLPGRLLVDAGQLDATSVTVQQLPVSLFLDVGWYYTAGVVQSAPTTQPTVRVIGTVYAPESDAGASLPGAAGATAALGPSGAVTAALPHRFTVAAWFGTGPRLIGLAA